MPQPLPALKTNKGSYPQVQQVASSNVNKTIYLASIIIKQNGKQALNQHNSNAIDWRTLDNHTVIISIITNQWEPVFNSTYSNYIMCNTSVLHEGRQDDNDVTHLSKPRKNDREI